MYYLHTDHLGAPRLMMDGAGTAVWWACENPAAFDVKKCGGTVGLNLRLPGQYYLAETGLNYNYFRDYDPETGRYLQSDPIGLAGGLNTYAYALNNPLRYIDPNGLTPPTPEGADELMRRFAPTYTCVEGRCFQDGFEEIDFSVDLIGDCGRCRADCVLDFVVGTGVSEAVKKLAEQGMRSFLRGTAFSVGRHFVSRANLAITVYDAAIGASCVVECSN